MGLGFTFRSRLKCWRTSQEEASRQQGLPTESAARYGDAKASREDCHARSRHGSSKRSSCTEQAATISRKPCAQHAPAAAALLERAQALQADDIERPQSEVFPDILARLAKVESTTKTCSSQIDQLDQRLRGELSRIDQLHERTRDILEARATELENGPVTKIANKMADLEASVLQDRSKTDEVANALTSLAHASTEIAKLCQRVDALELEQSLSWNRVHNSLQQQLDELLTHCRRFREGQREAVAEHGDANAHHEHEHHPVVAQCCSPSGVGAASHAATDAPLEVTLLPGAPAPPTSARSPETSRRKERGEGTAGLDGTAGGVLAHAQRSKTEESSLSWSLFSVAASAEVLEKLDARLHGLHAWCAEQTERLETLLVRSQGALEQRLQNVSAEQHRHAEQVLCRISEIADQCDAGQYSLNTLQAQLDELRASHSDCDRTFIPGGFGEEPWDEPMRQMEMRLRAHLADHAQDHTKALRSIVDMVHVLHDHLPELGDGS